MMVDLELIKLAVFFVLGTVTPIIAYRIAYRRGWNIGFEVSREACLAELDKARDRQVAAAIESLRRFSDKASEHLENQQSDPPPDLHH